MRASCSYEGAYQDGKFHGQGTYTFADGGRCALRLAAPRDAARPRRGMLRGLSQSGCGGGLTPVRASCSYVGAFQDGKFHGLGTFTYPSGDRCAHPSPAPRARAGAG